jgi:hypothetical protein
MDTTNPVWSVFQRANSQNIDILFFGNSNVRATFDSYVLNQIFNRQIYTFAPGTQDLDITYQTLQILLKYNQKPKVIILASYLLPRKNSERLKARELGLIVTNLDGINNFLFKLKASYWAVNAKDIPAAMFQLLRPTSTWSRWKKRNKSDAKFKTYDYLSQQQLYNSYGYMTYIRIARTKSISVEAMIAESKNEPIKIPIENFIIFDKIVKLSRENNIEIWVYNNPNTNESIEYANDLRKIMLDKFPYIKHFDIPAKNIKEIGLTTKDYNDHNHFNRNGAIKMTIYYAKLINERLGWQMNTNIFAYDGEQIEKIGDKEWRYTMKNMQTDALYQFQLRNNGKVVKTQKFSKQNYFDCDIDILQNSQFSVEVIMLPAETTKFDNETIQKIGMKASFMKY